MRTAPAWHGYINSDNLAAVGDVIVHVLVGGKWMPTNNAIRTTPEHNNFLIVCGYGDWSGFRTLAECERQMPELTNRGNGFAIVERL